MFEAKGEGRPRQNDFRIICSCQLHARRDGKIWRRTLRGATYVSQHLTRGTIALMVGISLSFGAVGIPMDAMNIHMPHFAKGPVASSRQKEVKVLPIFTSVRVSEDFLAPEAAPHAFTIEVAKEAFFKTEVPYGSIIYREALKNHLAPELVAAVVEAESDFRPRLVSEKNAQGLMQIIPSTGRLLGADDLFNPSENVAVGARYLRYLCNRFGDERMALAAYNAGEGNVEKFGGIPPFPETLNYVRRVAARRLRYGKRVRGQYVASMRLHIAEMR